MLKQYNLTQVIKFVIPPNMNKVPDATRRALENFYGVSNAKDQTINIVRMNDVKKVLPSK